MFISVIDPRFEKELIYALYNSLSKNDIRLRFFHQVSDYFINQYIESLQLSSKSILIGAIELRDKDSGMDFCYIDKNLIGFLEIKEVDNETTEIALVVHPNHRNKKIGETLFKQAYTIASNRGYKKICCICLDENIGMKKIIKKFDMKSYTSMGETESTKELNPISIFTLTDENKFWFDNTLKMLYDYNITNLQYFWLNFIKMTRS